jgi:ATP-binding cassette subfamily B protein
MARAADALEALARACRFPVQAIEIPAPPERFAGAGVDVQTRWLDAVAATLGVEVEAIEVPYADVDGLLQSAAPALLRVSEGETSFLLAVRASRRGAVSVLTPELSSRWVRLAVVRAAIRHRYEAPLLRDTDQLMEEAGVSRRRRARVRKAVLFGQLAATSVAGGWLLRLPPSAASRVQGAHAGVWSRLGLLAIAHACSYALWILSWWIVGRAALQGRLDRGWLIAWALLLLTLIPLDLVVTWLQGRVAIEGGALLKRRLLFGALRLEPEEIRHEGAGRLLGRVIEAQAIESLALAGGLLALVAILELAMAGLVLAAASAWLPVLLGLWAVIGAALARRYFRRRGSWTQSRLAMTHDLVERIVGHRTRLAQQTPDQWHDGEDQGLERYVAASQQMDRALVWLMTVGPRGWLLAGIVALSPGFVSGAATPTTLAVALGGILLGFRAFRRLSVGLSSVAGAGISWREVAGIFHAATRPQPIGSPAFALAGSDLSGGGHAPAESATDGAAGGALLEAHELSFRYPGRSEPVLSGCSLRVDRGDRFLMQGPSGGGKSTLASLLTGVRTPDSGLVLLDGVDRHTLGADRWRRRIVAAPQFHENHVFMGTFAFNALMGSEWPPQPEDVERAETVCRELGLGALLARMPGGMLQQVGETGWQLSHGERSRLFIARALLQRAEIVVLDESFAQLDPENLRLALACVLDRVPTVVLIAHP